MKKNGNWTTKTCINFLLIDWTVKLVVLGTFVEAEFYLTSNQQLFTTR